MDTLELYGTALRSRLLLGTAQYPSLEQLTAAVRLAQVEVLTVSLRRATASGGGKAFWDQVRALGTHLLPNTAGCHGVREAVVTAQMAREVFGTRWIKLEVIADSDTLCPDVIGLLEAARALIAEGFEVFPYTTDDLGIAGRLLDAGCRVLMPWAAPIGSGRGLSHRYGLRTLRAHFPDVPLIIDAGIGLPSQAAAAMELGYDAVLLNTAVARAGDPPAMAHAFARAVDAGRMAYLAGPVLPRDMAAPSTPALGQAVLA